jgi:murein L,D-transpeptidase YcbB/YkuD
VSEPDECRVPPDGTPVSRPSSDELTAEDEMTSDCPTLREGDPSPDGWVEYLEQLLGRPESRWSGVFDRALTDEVRHFQLGHQVRADGVVGPATWAALRAQLVGGR